MLGIVVVVGCGSATKPPPSNTVPPIASGVTLEGECVEPRADAKSRLEAGPMGIDTTAGNFEVSAIEDLDGDGTNDLEVLFGLGMLEKTVLYVKRGTCGIFVGDVDGSLSVGTARTKGMLELHVSESINCEGSRCGCEPGGAALIFDGKEYVVDNTRVTESVATECPDGGDPHD